MNKNTYETTFIVNAALEDSSIETIVSNVSEYIDNNGGSISLLEKWGRKRLAYPINKKNNGYYVYVLHDAPTTLPALLARFFHLEENVIRHLTLHLDSKALARRKKYLEDRNQDASEASPANNAPSEENKASSEGGDKQLEDQIAVKVTSKDA